MPSRPSWLAYPDVRYVCIGGGPADVSKAIQSGWIFALDRPQKAWEFANNLDPKNVDMYRQIGATIVLVQCNNGFPLEDETWAVDFVQPFVRAAKKAGLKVSFYISITNVFKNSMFEVNPWVTDCIQTDAEGKWIPYGSAVYQDQPLRYVCCLRKKRWEQFVKAKIRICLEGGADLLMFDNSGSWCFCEDCQKVFSQYTKKILGRSISLNDAHRQSQKAKVDSSAQIGGGIEENVGPWETPLALILDDFRRLEIRNFYMKLKRYAWTLRPGIPFDYEVHVQQLMGDCSDVVISEDAREPGLLDRAGWRNYRAQHVPDFGPAYELPKGESHRMVTNAGLMRYMRADGGQDRSFALFPHPGVWGLKPMSFAEQLLRGPQLPNRSLRRFIGESLSNFGGFVLGWEELSHFRVKPKSEREAIVRNYFHFLDRYRDHFKNAHPISNVAVVADRRIKRNLTFYDLLARRNVQFDILIDVCFSPADFDRRYESIVVPGIEWLSDEAGHLLERYVRNGGNLIVTGQSGTVHDGSYQKRPRWLFADIFSRSSLPEETFSTPYGKGTALYLPYSIEKIIERDKTRQDEFFGCLDRFDTARVQVRGGHHITARLGQDEKERLHLYLVNYDNRPVENVRVEFNVNVPVGRRPKVRAVSMDHAGAQRVVLRQHENQVQIIVPRLDTWEVVWVE